MAERRGEAPPRLIQDDAEFRDLVARLREQERYAVDTEFHRERTYFPHVALVQIADSHGVALVDALAVDLHPLAEVLEGPGLAVMHAARQDMEVLDRACGTVPSRLVDTQIAAGLVGIEYPVGLRNLILQIIGGTPKRHETRTDWRRRPLSQRQIDYALDDVRHLRTIRDKLHARLTELGRLEWLHDEMARWQGEVEQFLLHERWRRLSGSSGMDRKSMAIARELWRWRESEAERRDCPPRRVLRDDLLIELAKRQSADEKRIRAVRGFDRRNLAKLIPEIARHIARALEEPEDHWPAKAVVEPKPQFSVLGQFLFSALGSVARQSELAPSLVGSPNDIRDLIAYRTGNNHPGPPPILAVGWRARLVGRLFDDLLAGRVSVRIDDPKSDHPLAFDLAEEQRNR